MIQYGYFIDIILLLLSPLRWLHIMKNTTTRSTTATTTTSTWCEIQACNTRRFEQHIEYHYYWIIGGYPLALQEKQVDTVQLWNRYLKISGNKQFLRGQTGALNLSQIRKLKNEIMIFRRGKSQFLILLKYFYSVHLYCAFLQICSINR